MRNTGVEVRHLRVGDRIWLTNERTGRAAYWTVLLIHPLESDDRKVVLHLETRPARKGAGTWRLNDWVTVEWVPGIHERDLQTVSS